MTELQPLDRFFKFNLKLKKSKIVIEIPTDKRGKRANLTLRSYFSDYYELCSCWVVILFPNI